MYFHIRSWQGTIKVDMISFAARITSDKTLSEEGFKAPTQILTQIMSLILSQGTEHLTYQRSPLNSQ